MTMTNRSIRNCAARGSMLALAAPALAAEVTPERLANPQEPQNWLMNHRTYDGQRFSPLDTHQQGQRQEPEARLCGRARRHLDQREPAGDAAGRGRLHVHRRPVGHRLQDRRALRRRRPHRLAHGPQAGEVPAVQPRRRAVGQFRHLDRQLSAARRSRPTRRPARSSGRPTSPKASPTCSSRPRRSRSRTRSSSAPPAATAACATRSPALDAKTGKLAVAQIRRSRRRASPAARPGRTRHNAWQTGGGAMWVTGSYDVATNQVIWGTGNPVPMFDAYYRPGDNLYTNSVISWNPDDGKMNWYFQYTPGDHWDYDEVGTHILIDGQVNGETPQADHAFGAQRLPLHDGARQRADRDGQALSRQRQLDQGHRPEDRQAGRLRSEQGHPDLCRRRDAGAGRADQEDVPVAVRRQQLLAVDLQPEDQADLHPGAHRLRRASRRIRR